MLDFLRFLFIIIASILLVIQIYFFSQSEHTPYEMFDSLINILVIFNIFITSSFIQDYFDRIKMNKDIIEKLKFNAGKLIDTVADKYPHDAESGYYGRAGLHRFNRGQYSYVMKSFYESGFKGNKSEELQYNNIKKELENNKCMLSSIITYYFAKAQKSKNVIYANKTETILSVISSIEYIAGDDETQKQNYFGQLINFLEDLREFK